MNGPAGRTGRASRPPELGAVVRALRRNPTSVRMLVACTVAVVASVFEPGYMSLSGQVVQLGLRSPDSPAPWPLAAGILVLALITLLAGAFADLLGRRRFLVTGLVALTASNLLGLVLLRSPSQFVVADLLNTLAGAIVLPASVAIVTLASEPEVRPLAYGILFATQTTAGLAGGMLIPLLGNVWEGRATFVPVLVLCVVALILTRQRIPESRVPDTQPRSSIVINLVFVSVLFTVLFRIVTNAIRTGGPLLTITLVVLLALLSLAVRRLRRPHQRAGIEIYGGRELGVGIFAGLMLLLAQGAFCYQIYPFFVQVQHVDEVSALLRLVPFAVGTTTAGIMVARFILHFGLRRVLVFSFLLMAAALLALSRLRTDTSFWALALPTTAVGFAVGCGGAVRTALVMGAQPVGWVGSSSAINTAAGQSGNALGIILSSVLVTRQADRTLVQALRDAGVPEEEVANVASALASATRRMLTTNPSELPSAVHEVGEASYAHAFTAGTAGMFLLIGIGMVISALVVWIGMRRSSAMTTTVREGPAG